MSNHLAIAAVTATLVDVLQEAVARDLPGAKVLAARPETVPDPDPPEVHVYLYRVTPNAAWRNADLPTRSGNGAVMTRPQAALNLNYLFTFHGDEGELAPHRMLGSIVRYLHARPLLSRDLIASTVLGSSTDQNGIGLSDLADQVEHVRLTPITLELDQLSNLWSIFPQTSYSLSVAYEASVVLISPDETSAPSLPVHERNLFVETIRRPHIDRVEPEAGPTEPITIGTRIVIRGSQLQGDVTVVWFGAAPLPLAASAVSDQRIEVAVPAGARAGLLPLRIEHRRMMGDPPEARSAGQSNAVPLLVRPRIRQDPNTGEYIMGLSDLTYDAGAGRSEGTIDLQVDPAVGKSQHVTLHLTRIDPPAPAGEIAVTYSFNDETRDVAGVPQATNLLSIPFVDVRDGTYLVRLQVDGADSMLDRDEDPNSPTFRRFVAPTVDIPA